MTWYDLLFMHWQVPESLIRPLLPTGMEIDRFDGHAWIGVIPFHMTGVRPRLLPRFMASNFPEVNVRTYVRYGGKPGVWFFSLDAANRMAVWTARRCFHLPYRFAAMATSNSGEVVNYRSRRIGNPEVQLVCRYRPAGPPARSVPGKLDSWLTERYCLFAVNGAGRIFRGDIHHAPWLLQPAEVEIQTNTMTVPLGIALPPVRPVLYFAKRLEVVAWSLE